MCFPMRLHNTICLNSFHQLYLDCGGERKDFKENFACSGGGGGLCNNFSDAGQCLLKAEFGQILFVMFLEKDFPFR